MFSDLCVLVWGGVQAFRSEEEWHRWLSGVLPTAADCSPHPQCGGAAGICGHLWWPAANQQRWQLLQGPVLSQSTTQDHHPEERWGCIMERGMGWEGTKSIYIYKRNLIGNLHCWLKLSAIDVDLIAIGVTVFLFQWLLTVVLKWVVCQCYCWCLFVIDAVDVFLNQLSIMEISFEVS